jgi:hypothetical protein
MSEHLTSDLTREGGVLHTCQQSHCGNADMGTTLPSSKPPPSRKISAVHIRPAAPPPVSEWLNSLGQGEVPILMVEGTPEFRHTVYGWCSAIEGSRWPQMGIREEVVLSILTLGAPIFLDLLTSEYLTVEGPLRAMVDQRFYLVSDLFRVLIEARFLVQEGTNPESPLQAITQWILGGKLTPGQEKLFELAGVSRRVQPTEQLDLVCALIAIASQSGVINRLTLAFDRIEKIALSDPKDKRTYFKELDEVVFAATRWEKLGSTLGIILGAEKLSLLNPSPKLGKLLNSGVIYRQPV